MMRGTAELPPAHYERLRLDGSVRLVAWAVTAILATAALVSAVGLASTPLGSLVAGVLGATAAVAAFAAYRLGDCEVRATKVSFHVGFGPLSTAYPLWGVRPVRTQPATSWRRWYANHEVVVALDDPRGTRQLSIPTREPAELSAALSREARADTPA